MECIIINTTRFSQVVKLNTIIYCQAEGSYTKVILNNNRTIISSKNLSWFEKNINSEIFIRTHRSYYANLEYVDQIFQNEGKISLLNGSKIPVSRYKFKQFLESLYKLVPAKAS